MAWVGNGTNAELSEKYQTLITPNGTAFSIWAVIFLSQAVFCIVQMLPEFRSTVIVQQGVKYWYVFACFFQICWTLAFAYERIWMALIFMTHIWASLLGMLKAQYKLSVNELDEIDSMTNVDTNEDEERSSRKVLDFWIFRFPFAIHFGWLTAATALNISVYAVSKEASSEVQVAIGIVSLAVLHAASVWSLFGLLREPNFTVASVVAWASWWIHVELESPKESIVQRFSQDVIGGVSLAAALVSFVIVGQMLVRLIALVKPTSLCEKKANGDGNANELTENLL